MLLLLLLLHAPRLLTHVSACTSALLVPYVVPGLRPHALGHEDQAPNLYTRER